MLVKVPVSRIYAKIKTAEVLMSNDKGYDKFTRPLGRSNDGKTMNVFSSLQEAQERLKKQSTIIVVDENGDELEMPMPGTSACERK